jgi:hypothetical protein
MMTDKNYERHSLLPKEPCAYCGKIAWTWTIENGKNVAKPHNPERCFSNPISPHYPIYKNLK